jgi:AmpD protein
MSVAFAIDTVTGLVQPARQCHSPNCDQRPPAAVPELVVIHGISLPPGEFGNGNVEALFLNKLDWNAHPYFATLRGLRVSAHLLICRDGEVVQFVPFSKRAWHAGESRFRRRSACNDFSIGIELEGEDERAYDRRQYEVLAAVIAALTAAYPRLTARTIAAHADIAPGRKTDPGPAFDWLRLYDGLSGKHA